MVTYSGDHKSMSHASDNLWCLGRKWFVVVGKDVDVNGARR